MTVPLPATPAQGLKTTEFITTLLTMAALLIPGIPSQYLPAVAAVGGLYVASRTLLKAVHALGYAKSVPDLPALPAGSTTITTVPKA